MSNSEQAAKKPGILSKTKSVWFVAVGLALAAVFGALTILGDAAATTTYYVLARDIPARTMVTPAMLTPVTTSEGGQPRNAYDLVYIRQNEVWSKVPLSAGDVVSRSNVGPLDRISEELPSNFVVASFSVPADDAVGGKVRRGDHVDVIAIGERGSGRVSKVVLQHVLVLDVTVDPSSITSAAQDDQAGPQQPGPESEAARSGIPQVYTIGVSPEDATKLALVRDMELFVTLSSRDTDPVLLATTNESALFDDTGVADSSLGRVTDASGWVWTPVMGGWSGVNPNDASSFFSWERDETGAWVGRAFGADAGNAEVTLPAGMELLINAESNPDGDPSTVKKGIDFVPRAELNPRTSSGETPADNTSTAKSP